jgi:hypothetical protein
VSDVQTSVPTISEFNPYLVPYQIKVISLIRQEYNYSLGPLEILLSGSVGSAKSLLACHIIATHVLLNPSAGVLIGRRTLKDLKNTIWDMLLKHYPYLRQFWNKSEMTIRLPSGAVIYGVSWDDGNYDKFRSYELSLAVIEELTENDDRTFYDEIRMRVGRARAKENLVLSLTNPDSPHHWAYGHFIENGSETRRVFYSKTEQNPFLPTWYIQSLKKNLSEKLSQRMLEGLWIELDSDRIYYAFEDSYNFIDKDYEWDFKLPLDLMFDFNNSKAGKPMSVGVGQSRNGVYHIAQTFIIAGLRTLDMCDEIADAGLLDLPFPSVRVYGDATGRHSDTRNNRSDWDLIEGFIANYTNKTNKKRLEYEIEVGLSNPPIKFRHNTLNGLFRNALGQTFIFIYRQAKDACKGFRLTQYKAGAKLIENDDLREQHVTTAIGYYVCRNKLSSEDIAPLSIS